LKLIVDTNIVLAAVIRDSTTRRLLFEPRLELLSPDFLFEEGKRHTQEDEDIRVKTGLSTDELTALFEMACTRIKLVPFSEYSEKIQEAKKLSKHKEDEPYFAVALKTRCPIWSSDKGMMEQNEVEIITTGQLISWLNGE